MKQDLMNTDFLKFIFYNCITFEDQIMPICHSLCKINHVGTR